MDGINDTLLLVMAEQTELLVWETRSQTLPAFLLVFGKQATISLRPPEHCKIFLLNERVRHDFFFSLCPQCFRFSHG